MTKTDARREVVAVRLTETDRARLEFWARLQQRTTGSTASELLSRAVNAALAADCQKALGARSEVEVDDGDDLVPHQAA